MFMSSTGWLYISHMFLMKPFVLGQICLMTWILNILLECLLLCGITLPLRNVTIFSISYGALISMHSSSSSTSQTVLQICHLPWLHHQPHHPLMEPTQSIDHVSCGNCNELLSTCCNQPFTLQEVAVWSSWRSHVLFSLQLLLNPIAFSGLAMACNHDRWVQCSTRTTGVLFLSFPPPPPFIFSIDFVSKRNWTVTCMPHKATILNPTLIRNQYTTPFSPTSPWIIWSHPSDVFHCKSPRNYFGLGLYSHLINKIELILESMIVRFHPYGTIIQLQ